MQGAVESLNVSVASALCLYEALRQHARRVSMSPWMQLGLAIVAEVVATSALKASAGFTRLWPSVLCAVGYAWRFTCCRW